MEIAISEGDASAMRLDRGLPFLVLSPFVEARCRDQATPRLNRSLEGRFLQERFRFRVDGPYFGFNLTKVRDVSQKPHQVLVTLEFSADRSLPDLRGAEGQ